MAREKVCGGTSLKPENVAHCTSKAVPPHAPQELRPVRLHVDKTCAAARHSRAFHRLPRPKPVRRHVITRYGYRMPLVSSCNATALPGTRPRGEAKNVQLHAISTGNVCLVAAFLKIGTASRRYFPATRGPIAAFEPTGEIMEQALLTPLQAEIVNDAGHLEQVRLVAYLGQDRCAHLQADRREVVVAADQIRTLDAAA